MRSIIVLVSAALRSPSGSLLLRERFLPPPLEAAPALAGLEVPDVTEDRGHEHGGALAPARSRDVDLARAAHAVPVQVGREGVARLRTALERRQLVQEGRVLRLLVLDPL
jgi:hypothetical protein